MIILPNIYEKLFPLGGFNSILEYFDYYMFKKNIAILDEPLDFSEERRKWLSYYPKIDNFPNLKSYIENEKSILLSLVNDELSDIDLYLPKNEILFHSGNLPAQVPLEVGATFQLKEIFSATLDPYIANVHDVDDNVFWIIEIKENIRCFPVPCEDEYEIIILDKPIARITNIIKDKTDLYWNGIEIEPQEKTIIHIELFR